VKFLLSCERRFSQENGVSVSKINEPDAVGAGAGSRFLSTKCVSCSSLQCLTNFLHLSGEMRSCRSEAKSSENFGIPTLVLVVVEIRNLLVDGSKHSRRFCGNFRYQDNVLTMSDRAFDCPCDQYDASWLPRRKDLSATVNLTRRNSGRSRYCNLFF
jgi:hypothetical protein